MNWLGFDLFSLINLVQAQDVWRRVARIFGAQPPTTRPAADKAAEPLQAEASGKGFSDELLYFLAAASALRINQDDFRPEDIDVFLEILEHYNALGKKKTAELLARIVGFKGSVKTTKTPLREVSIGEGPKAKLKTEFEELTQDINPNGATIMFLFKQLGKDRSIKLIDAGHLLDNATDKAAATATVAKTKLQEVAALAQELWVSNDTRLHLTAIWWKLGCNTAALRKILASEPAQELQEVIRVAEGAENQREANERFQAFLVRTVNRLSKKNRETQEAILGETPVLRRWPVIIIVALAIFGSIIYILIPS